MYLSYPPLWNIVPDMDGFTTVRHWLDWASHGGPGYLNQDELPVEILECPLDVDLMIFRIKCFAASVVLHQAFVDATQIPSEDANRFRHVMDKMDQLCHRFHSKTWEALRTLRHDTDSARHHFFHILQGSSFVCWPIGSPLSTSMERTCLASDAGPSLRS